MPVLRFLARSVASTLAGIAIALVLTSCATPPTDTTDASSPTPNLVWPEPPEKPRVQFVRSVGKPEDLGFSKNIFTRVFEAIFGGPQEQLVRPMAVVDTGDVLFVADPGVRGVHRFDRKAGDYTLLRQRDDQALLSPVGMALGEGGAVYVTDSALKVVFVIKPGAEFAEPLALTEPLKQPTGIAYDAATKRLFVTDTGAHTIVVLDQSGKQLAKIGERGEQPGQFNYPTYTWLDTKGRLFVTDSLNFRTQIIDTRPDTLGKVLGAFGTMGDNRGEAPRQKGIALDSFGHVYVTDSLLSAIQIFSDSGQFLLPIGGLGQGIGEFWLPAGIFIGKDDTIYVADAYNQRIQVFRYIGGPT